MRELEGKFKEVFSREPEIELRSPGRVNLIGEHTDYNDGFVFPAAINLEIRGLAAVRDDSGVNVYSMDFNEFKSFDINNDLKKEGSWTDYIKGVIVELKKSGEISKGADIVYSSNLPVGSGLSSSAAFEVINAMLFSKINGIDLSLREIALLSQRAENKFVGVNCGIMDQFSIALGKKDSALFLDTKTLSYEIVPLNMKGYKIIISNTNKPRELSSSAYNERREECETAVSILKKNNYDISSLRDLNSSQLKEIASILPEINFKRVKHVVEENERVLKSVEYLKSGDLESFGKLLNESHKSLKDYYEVSCGELDILVEEAMNIEGTLGSRMTGAGFGGCTISIVREDRIKDFIEKVGENYFKRTDLKADFYVSEAVNGAEIFFK